MYLKLNDSIVLESFIDRPYGYHINGSNDTWAISKEEYEFLLKCDGHTFIECSELSAQMIRRRFVNECDYEENIHPIKPIVHLNRYMPRMNLQITGVCNYNCRHCFNAKDNLPLQSQLSFEQILRLLDECVECGVHAFTITGGEPMAHPQYKEIIEEIYKRGMNVFDLNTNGYFITEEMLDWMKSIHYMPKMKISFDGIGFHNWMRGYDKAEEKTLKAIQLCLKKGFDVKVQMNINKKNVSSILPSIIMLDEMGVGETRIIKTTAAPRWLKNANGQSMTIEEYYDAMLEILHDYLKEDRNMVITGWLICRIDPVNKYYNLDAIRCSENEFSQHQPLCRGAVRMIAVGSNGNVFPCMQFQGWYEEHQMVWGNIITDGLPSILRESKYLNLIDLNLQDRLNSGSECKDCKYLRVCAGGCPAIAQLTSGDILLADGSKCIFLKKGYYQKFVDAIPSDYRNVKPLWL